MTNSNEGANVRPDRNPKKSRSSIVAESANEQFDQRIQRDDKSLTHAGAKPDPPDDAINVGVFSNGTLESQANLLSDSNISAIQRQTIATQIGKVQGNQHLQQVIAVVKPAHTTTPQSMAQNKSVFKPAGILQRHPGHTGGHNLSRGQEDEVNRTINRVLQRAVLTSDTTVLANIKAASAPVSLMDGAGAGATSLGNLAAGDQIRILDNPGGATVHIHVETGALAGQRGHIPSNSFNAVPDPTSLRTPLVGTEDAYAQLTTEINRPRPRRGQILDLMNLRMTANQLARLAQPGNAEFIRLRGLRVIRSQDLLRIMGLLGLPLHRKLTEYLAKRGRNVSALRQIFATANDNERLAVAQDNDLMGRLSRILGPTHPEIIFGPTTLSTLYPADGSLDTLQATHPNLANWLRRHNRPDADISQAATERATVLQDALAEINNQGAAARGQVMSALQAAPRGAALPQAERNALDQIEEAVYNESSYTSRDMGVIFITRWGRPFRQAASRPKTFLHRLYQAIRQMPENLTLFVNTLERIGENRDPGAAGSFDDWLTSATFGTIVADRPGAMEPLHAAGAQNSRIITVNEPHVDLYRRGTRVQVTQADGSQVRVTVQSVNARQRQLRLSRRVNVAAGGELNPSPGLNQVWQDFAGGTALRVTASTPLFADNAGAPNLGSRLGVMDPGYTVAELGRQNVGGTNYVHCRVYEGALRQREGWVEAAHVAGLGGQTVAQVDFDQTMRHEMGHALDLQLGGFSNFSAPSKAQWRKYTGVRDWATDLARVAGIANPNTNQTFNGVTMSFHRAARTFSQAVQDETTGDAQPRRALRWLRGWVAAGGSQNVMDTITQYGAITGYFNQNGVGLPAIGGQIFGAHYTEWFSANAAARTDSLSVGISPYAYTCTYEFFADHYAAYTGPGVPPQQFARAVPPWALNYFDRLVGRAGAGPSFGLGRRRMGP